jgi:phage virion morphogenesis protein
MLENIGAFLDSDVTRRFIAGVEPDGTAWKPSERAQSEGGKTLVDTTALMKSTTHNVLGDDMVEHGVTEIYGAIHHFGGETGRNQATKIEARPIIGIAQRQEARIDKMVTGFMNSWFQ